MSVLLYSDKTGNPERHFKRIKNVLKKEVIPKKWVRNQVP